MLKKESIPCYHPTRFNLVIIISKFNCSSYEEMASLVLKKFPVKNLNIFSIRRFIKHFTLNYFFMRKKWLIGLCTAMALVGGILFAADHIDAPAVTGTGSTSTGTDITDIYAFQSPTDNTKMV